MDDLTLLNLINLDYFFSRYPYRNLVITTLGKFGPKSGVMFAEFGGCWFVCFFLINISQFDKKVNI